ncbi:MAG: DinB family protein [Gemmatimonadales bacterium]
MSIAESMLAEFDSEMATTRRLLAIVPNEAADWKPHEKSMSLGALAAHVGAIPFFVLSALQSTEFDTHPPGGQPTTEFPKWVNRDETLARYDKLVAAGRKALASAKDEELMVPWSFKKAGVTRMTMPRIAVIRVLFLNHLIHHRGQLSVYLRLRDVPLPSIYGPTADSPM